MTTLEEDEYLRIQLLSYHKSSGQTEGYYFLEMSTLQATTLLPRGLKIITSEIVANTDENKYLDRKFESIGEFNDFFITNSAYYIHNCEIKLENGTTIGSHDDGEVSVQFACENIDETFLDEIFKKYKLDKSLIGELKRKPGHYFTIDKESKITGDFETFDDYVKSRDVEM
jgi:hypothetical protein